MKYLKMLGLVVMAAASLMAFAGSASAIDPVLTSTGAEYTETIDMSATESLFLEASVMQVTCTESTVHGSVTKNEGGVASGALTTFSFGNCGTATVDTLAAGEFEVKAGGEVVFKGNRVTFMKPGVPTCVYGGGTGTKLGVLKNGGGMQLEANLPKQTGSNFLCPNTAKWEGRYQVTTPHSVTVDDPTPPVNPVLTSTATAVKPGATIDMSATESLFLEASVLQTTCTESTVHGSVTKNEGGVASGALTTFSFGNCGTATVDTLAAGEFDVKAGGEVVFKGNRFTIMKPGTPSCVYGGGAGTKLGVLKNGGGMQIEANLPKQTGSNFLCPNTAKWEGRYQVTTPHSVTVD